MRMWQRLLWREYRESAPFVLIGVALPILLLAFRKYRGDIVLLPVMVIMVMVAVWAAARAQEKRDSELPLPVPLRLASRYLLPVIGVSMIGLAVGCLAAFRFYPSAHPNLIPLTIGLCIVIYMLCLVGSSVLTLIPAIFMGLVGVFISFALLFDNPPLAVFHWLPLRLLCVALVTAVFWEGYRGRGRLVIARIALPVLMTVAIFWAPLSNIEIDNLTHTSSSLPPSAPVIAVYNSFDSEGTLSMDYDHIQRGYICLFDKRTPRRYFISPARIAPSGDYIRSLACLDRRVVLFAVQAPKDVNIRVVAWDAPTGQVNERFRFTGWRGMISRYPYASQSPDNRYLLLGVDSKIGLGYDIWLLDMQRNGATLVVPNVEYRSDDYSSPETIWTPGIQYLWLYIRLLRHRNGDQ